MALSSLLLLGISCALCVIKAEEHVKAFHVCGSDGKNYDSIGDLNQVKLENPDLRVRHVGVCRKRSPEYSTYVEYYESVDYEDRTRACPLIGSPVCGTDGMTYRNECFLYYAKRKNPNLHLRHRGDCKENPKELNNEIETNQCQLILDPVCGSDGRSYGNECFLNAHKKYDSTLYMKHTGWCKLKLDARNMLCHLAYRPLCGTDGKTYGNECIFSYQKTFNPALEIKHKGECDEPENMQSFCSLDYKPVCGNDGKTYGNECFFGYQKRLKPTLEIKHEGECEEKIETAIRTACHATYLPVCGTNGRTYANECLFDVNKKFSKDLTLEIKHIGECNRKSRVLDYESTDLFEEWANTMMCKPRGPPVCGTDGKTHGNLCILNANKKYHPSLRLKHFGRCKNSKRSRIKYTKTNVAIEKDDENGKSLNIGVRMSNYNL